MGLENCQIYLDNSTATYYPGQTVSGRVDLNFSSEKKVRGIEVKFKGTANTRWTESESYTDSNGKSQTRHVSYTGNEEYFNFKYYVVGGPNNEAIKLPIGKHVYNFSCNLPRVLPSSFEGEYGYVRYTVKVTLVRPWKFDQDLKAAFSVIDNLDLNLDPILREPATLTMEKYFCCLFCKSGPLVGILKVPCTGFVSGQTIPLTLEIDNISNVGVSLIKLKLKKVIHFYSQSPSRKTKTKELTIVDLTDDAVIAANTTKNFNRSILIPSVPPSNLTNCNIIDLKYELRITVEVDGMHRNMYGNLPITIGTIPLRDLVPMHAPRLSSAFEASPQPVLGWIPAPPNTPPIDPSLLPPPSYEECQFGAKTLLEDGESQHTKINTSNWAPSYPVYHFNMAPSAPMVNAPNVPASSTGPSAPVLPPY